MKKKTFKRLLKIITIFSFLVIFSSCDKMISAIQEEFDSERLHKQQLDSSTLTELSTPVDPIVYLKYSEFFMIPSESFKIEPVENQLNTYKIQIQTSPSIFKFGGKEKILLKTINNFVFINRWAQGSFNIGGIVLYNDTLSIDSKNYLNVFFFAPELDLETNTFSFLFKPEGIVQTTFLDKSFKTCVLLIYSEEENF
jgi:hypothetical protein